VQGIVSGQVDLDAADRAPTVLVQMLLYQLSQRVGQLSLPRDEPLVVRRRQRHPIPVGRQHLTGAHHIAFVRGLPLERGRNLDRLHLALEHPCERRADDAFEASLEALRKAHRGLRPALSWPSGTVLMACSRRRIDAARSPDGTCPRL
jgi:hypothetical protein